MAALWTQATGEDGLTSEDLANLRTELGFAGNLSLVHLPRKSVLRSTSTQPSLDWSQFPPDRSVQVSNWNGKTLWAWAPVLSVSQGESLWLVLEADASPFNMRLLGYILHYVLLAVGLLTILGFYFIRSSHITHRLLDTTRKSTFTLLKETSDGILFLDNEGKITRLNDSAARILDEFEKTVVGRPLFQKLGKGFIWQVLDTRKDVIRDCIERKEHLSSKAKLILWDERIRYISFTASPLQHDRNQKSKGAILIFQDITSDVIREQELIHQKSLLEQTNEQLKEQVLQDPLTHLLNRQYLIHILEPAQLRWTSQEGCSMLLIDIDHFKKVNDSMGHLQGDALLKNFAQFLRGFFRKTDRVIRYGGDEFVVLLPQTDLKAATRIAGNLLDQVRKTSIDPVGTITISLGIAELQPQEPGREWLARADAALYNAKHSGKNQARAHDANELEILN